MTDNAPDLRAAAKALSDYMEHHLQTVWFGGEVTITFEQMRTLDKHHKALIRALRSTAVIPEAAR